jgi:hypothetical protein
MTSFRLRAASKVLGRILLCEARMLRLCATRCSGMLSLAFAVLLVTRGGHAINPTEQLSAPGFAQLPNRPMLLLGDGTRLVILDPEDGHEFASFKPFDALNVRWAKFQANTAYILAEGLVSSSVGVQPGVRALVLFDEAGSVRWTSTQTLGPRVSPDVFLNERGFVAYDSADGGRVVAPSGTVTFKTNFQVPLGPVVSDALPVGAPGEWQTTWALGITSSGGATITDVPPFIAENDTEVIPFVNRRSVSIGRVLRIRKAQYPAPLPETEHSGPLLELLRVVALPVTCVGDGLEVISETLSRSHYFLTCAGSHRYDLDVVKGLIRPLPNRVSTIGPDGSHLALETKVCDSRLMRSWDGSRYFESVTLERGYRWDEPDLVCGHVSIVMSSQGPCSRSRRKGTPMLAYVERTPGQWVSLPYKVADGACGPNARVAFLRREAAQWELVVASLDHAERRVSRPSFLSLETPLAWIHSK